MKCPSISYYSLERRLRPIQSCFSRRNLVLNEIELPSLLGGGRNRTKIKLLLFDIEQHQWRFAAGCSLQLALMQLCRTVVRPASTTFLAEMKRRLEKIKTHKQSVRDFALARTLRNPTQFGGLKSSRSEAPT